MSEIFDRVVERQKKYIEALLDRCEQYEKDDGTCEWMYNDIQEAREALALLLKDAEKLTYFMEGLDERNIGWDLYDGKIIVKACVFGHNNTYDYGEHPPEKYVCTVDDNFLRELFAYENFVLEGCGHCCGCGDW